MLIISMMIIGCEEQEKGIGFIDPSIAAMENEPEPEPEPIVKDEPEMRAEDFQKEPEAMMNPKPEPEPEVVDPFCGDGTCNSNENCRTCAKDCGCKNPRVCKDGECIEPACDTDSDCADAEACTIDKCYFPAHPNAYCGHEDMDRCRNNDDCCPGGDCHADNDNDCEPDCGNDVCETGEDEDDCPKDCLDEADCGNQVCEDGEDSYNCPGDCGQFAT